MYLLKINSSSFIKSKFIYDNLGQLYQLMIRRQHIVLFFLPVVNSDYITIFPICTDLPKRIYQEKINTIQKGG